MLISDAHRFLFVHVQKTGGSTIDRIFDEEVPDARRVPGVSRHSAYRRLVLLEPGLADYWSFGFVRNPWARMVSWFAMVSGMYAKLEAGNVQTLRKFERFPKTWGLFEPFAHDFDKFVLEAPRAIPKVGRTQVETLTTPEGRRVDFVGRTENFVADLNVVRERLGLPVVEAAPRKNVSSHAHYSTYYNDLTRRAVAEHFAADIEAFGYTFDAQP